MEFSRRLPKMLMVFGALGALLIAGGAFFSLRRQPSSGEKVSTPAEEAQSGGEVPKMPYETFTTEDGSLSFEYPRAWIRAEIKNLETVLPKNFIDKYELTMPLILSDPRGAQVSLSVYQFEKGTSLDAAMDAFKADLVEMGQPYNEVSRQTVGEALVIDSTVDAGQGGIVKVRDLLFLVMGETKDAIYNLSFAAREPNWGEYEAIFSHIQSSARLSL